MSDLEQPFSTTPEAIGATKATAFATSVVTVNGLHSLLGKQALISLNDASNPILTCIEFGDSLAPRVAGHLLRGIQTQYAYGSAGIMLGNNANPESSGGTYAGLSYSLAGGAALGSDDYTIWPNGRWYSCPNGSTIQNSNGSSTITYSRWAWYYVVEPGGGTFNLETSPDGSIWTSRGTFDTNGTLAGAVASYSSTATAFSRVNVTSGTVKIIGASARRSSGRGTLIGAISRGGLSISNAASTSAAILTPILTDIAPDIVTVHMDDDGADMQLYLPTVLSRFRTANPKCSFILIGNGPKDGFATQMIAQSDYYRSLAENNSGYAFVDGYRLLRSYEWLVELGWQGDGTHLSDLAYSYVAEVMINGLSAFASSLFGRSTRPFLRYENTPSVSVRQMAISRDENSSPAITWYTDSSFGFDSEGRINRAFFFKNSSGATTYFAVTANEAVFPHQLQPRAYRANMSGALGTQYTTPSTGGVEYVDSNEWVWRNASSGRLSRLPIEGAGSPEGVVTANVGRMYLRTDGGTGTTLYIKESGTGNTGWVAK